MQKYVYDTESLSQSIIATVYNLDGWMDGQKGQEILAHLIVDLMTIYYILKCKLIYITCLLL